jgi:hypothetical protein
VVVEALVEVVVDAVAGEVSAWGGVTTEGVIVGVGTVVAVDAGVSKAAACAR